MANKPHNKYDNMNKFVSVCLNYVDSIKNFKGEDRLIPWYEYLLWIEETYVIDFNEETIFDKILAACLCEFENEERYKQDRRLIKLFIKFIYFQSDQHLHYEQMISKGFGTKVADLYINWAFYYEKIGDNERADQIFKRGIMENALPSDVLQTAHRTFGFLMSQRLLYRTNVEHQERTLKRFENISALRIIGTGIKLPKSRALASFDMETLNVVCIPKLTQSQQSNQNLNTSFARTIIDSLKKLRYEMKKKEICTHRLAYNNSPYLPPKRKHSQPVSQSLIAKHNQPQSEWIVERIASNLCPENNPHRFNCKMRDIYPSNSTEEFSMEEIMWKKPQSMMANRTKNIIVKKSLIPIGSYANQNLLMHSRRDKTLLVGFNQEKTKNWNRHVDQSANTNKLCKALFTEDDNNENRFTPENQQMNMKSSNKFGDNASTSTSYVSTMPTNVELKFQMESENENTTNESLPLTKSVVEGMVAIEEMVHDVVYQPMNHNHFDNESAGTSTIKNLQSTNEQKPKSWIKERIAYLEQKLLGDSDESMDLSTNVTPVKVPMFCSTPVKEPMTCSTPVKRPTHNYSFSYELLETTAEFERQEAL